MRKYFFMVLMVGLLIGILNEADAAGVVFGKIVDRSERGMSGVTVQHTGNPSLLVTTKKTDPDGYYYFENVEESFSLSVTKDGYISINKDSSELGSSTGGVRRCPDLMLLKGVQNSNSPALTGIVEDSVTGDDLTFVRVRFKAVSGVAYIGYTDNTGVFSDNPAIPCGTYTVTLTKQGYKTKKQKVLVDTSDPSFDFVTTMVSN